MPFYLEAWRNIVYLHIIIILFHISLDVWNLLFANIFQHCVNSDAYSDQCLLKRARCITGEVLTLLKKGWRILQITRDMPILKPPGSEHKRDEKTSMRVSYNGSCDVNHVCLWQEGWERYWQQNSRKWKSRNERNRIPTCRWISCSIGINLRDPQSDFMFLYFVKYNQLSVVIIQMSILFLWIEKL